MSATLREATRLRRLAIEAGADDAEQGDDAADALTTAGSGGAGERVPVRRLDDAGLAADAAAVADPAVLTRYRAKVATVPGSECLWWTGAVAGRSEREHTDGGVMAGSGTRRGG